MNRDLHIQDLKNIRGFLDAIHPMDDPSWKTMATKLRERRYEKGEVINGVGDVQRDLLFIVDGVQFSYFLKEDKMHVMAFTYPIGISGIPESFFSAQPSTYTLETVSTTRAHALSRQDLIALYDSHPSVERLFRKITEAMLIITAHGRYRQISTSSEERFAQFAQQSAHLFNRVPHKLIASYLGIHPTNFSKLYNTVRI